MSSLELFVGGLVTLKCNNKRCGCRFNFQQMDDFVNATAGTGT
jgi:hypothetical protein